VFGKLEKGEKSMVVLYKIIIISTIMKCDSGIIQWRREVS